MEEMFNYFVAADRNDPVTGVKKFNHKSEGTSSVTVNSFTSAVFISKGVHMSTNSLPEADMAQPDPPASGQAEISYCYPRLETGPPYWCFLLCV